MTQYNIGETLFKQSEPIKQKERLKIMSEISSVVDNERIYDLNVEFNEYYNTGEDEEIIFINGDRNSSIITAKMLMKGVPVNLTGVTVSMNLKEGYNYPTTVICTDIDTTNSVVTIRLSPYLVDEIGLNTFEFSLMKGDIILVSRPYKYRIIESIGEGDIGTDEEMTALQTLIQTVQTMEQDLTFDVTSQDIDDIIGMVDGVL